MKTVDFTINSETGEYQFPEWGYHTKNTCSSELTLKETKFNHDNSIAYQYAFSADEEVFNQMAREAFTEKLLPNLFDRAVTCSGDDDYYDYLPDYVDMLIQANEALGAFDPENFETFLNKLNEALHALHKGWKTPEE